VAQINSTSESYSRVLAETADRGGIEGDRLGILWIRVRENRFLNALGLWLCRMKDKK
jgi:hypothetical protein